MGRAQAQNNRAIELFPKEIKYNLAEEIQDQSSIKYSFWTVEAKTAIRIVKKEVTSKWIEAKTATKGFGGGKQCSLVEEGRVDQQEKGIKQWIILIIWIYTTCTSLVPKDTADLQWNHQAYSRQLKDKPLRPRHYRIHLPSPCPLLQQYESHKILARIPPQKQKHDKKPRVTNKTPLQQHTVTLPTVQPVTHQDREQDYFDHWRFLQEEYLKG